MRKDENIIKKLWNKVTIEQWHKTLRVILICVSLMVVSEIILEIPIIKNLFGANLIKGKSGWLIYFIVWLVMFIQVAIIPIPALPILTACNQISGLVGTNFKLNGLFSIQTLFFVTFITSATVIGSIVSYWLGRIFGKRAVVWVAGSEKDYKLWVKKLNGKTGKLLYTITVLLPVFPDDLISLVIGSIKMNFAFYTVINIICKFIGLYCTLIFMRIPGIDLMFGKSTQIPWALIIYSILLIVVLIARKIINHKVNINQPKEIKLEVVKETILNYFYKNKSVNKELIIDYKLNKKLRTYLASKIYIHKFYEVDKNNAKSRVRILIECNTCNYKQIIFDNTYELTTLYDTVIEDIKSILMKII